MPRETHYEEVEVDECKRTTERACQLVIDGGSYWVPFSLIESGDEGIDEDFTGSLMIAEWYLKKEGIAY